GRLRAFCSGNAWTGRAGSSYNPYNFVEQRDISLGVDLPPKETSLRSFKLPSFCVTIAILWMLPLSSGQESKGTSGDAVAPQIAHGLKAFAPNGGGASFQKAIDQTVGNGVPGGPYNPTAFLTSAIDVGMCSWSPRPAWCRGTDVGAWTNSAIALIRCGDVYIPSGTYT